MHFVTGYIISSSQPCEVGQNDQNYEKGDLNEYSDSKGWPLKKKVLMFGDICYR